MADEGALAGCPFFYRFEVSALAEALFWICLCARAVCGRFQCTM